jgi:branched-chain amino acid aminotransferase
MKAHDLEFLKLPFGYQRTDANVRCWYRDRTWSPAEVVADEFVSLHLASACLHYGQAVFEGLKAYERPDGEVHAFRPDENARRMRRSAERLLMEPVPEEIFLEAVALAVRTNRRFVPPFGSGGSLYIRPLELGTSAQLGQKPSGDYLLAVYASPVGPYFQTGFAPIRILVEEESDRAAPGGIGDVKAAGNYAAGLRALLRARSSGFADVIYLDAREKKYIDELSTTNFFAIRGNTFITPASPSILASITNMSVRQLASDLGLNVEQRPVLIDEISTFDEAGALGTAAGIIPVGVISYGGKEYVYGEDGRAGPITTRLYERLLAIQTGLAEDIYGWCQVIPGDDHS